MGAMISKCEHREVKADGIRAGHQIPGSNLYREFCSRCGEAMRVSRDEDRLVCTACRRGGIGLGNANVGPREDDDAFLKAEFAQQDDWEPGR